MESPAENVRPAPAARGKAVVLGMFGLALAAAAFAWWWNHERGARTLAFYGPEAARLIRVAPTVELLAGPDDEAGPPRDISRAPGLLNARTSLLDDASYDWSQAPVVVPAPPSADQPAAPRAVVRFRDSRREVALVFDFAARTVRADPAGPAAVLIPKTAAGWQAFVERQISR